MADTKDRQEVTTTRVVVDEREIIAEVPFENFGAWNYLVAFLFYEYVYRAYGESLNMRSFPDPAHSEETGETYLRGFHFTDPETKATLIIVELVQKDGEETFIGRVVKE